MGLWGKLHICYDLHVWCLSQAHALSNQSASGTILKGVEPQGGEDLLRKVSHWRWALKVMPTLSSRLVCLLPGHVNKPQSSQQQKEQSNHALLAMAD